jgi:lipopolysaccharide export system permease protein
MKLLQRYIFGELVRVFGLLVVVLTVMLVFLGLFHEATDRGLGAVQVLQIMPFVVPSMLPFTIPATLLLAVCVVYGRISGDLEVTAAKAAGVSATQLLLPALVLSSSLAVGSFGLTNFVIPWAVTNIEQIVTQAIEDIFLEVLTSQHLYSDARQGYSITVHDVRNRTLMDATFRYRLKNHQQITLRAETARIKFDLENHQIKLQLKRWKSSQPGSDFDSEMDDLELSFPMPQSIGKVKARHMTLTALQKGIGKSQQDLIRNEQLFNQEVAMLLLTGDIDELAGAASKKYQVDQAAARTNIRRLDSEVHGRFAMAASCLFFTLVGGPFAMLQARRQFITTFIICFLPILVVYYPVMFLMMNLAKSGTVDSWWAVWVPNAILGVWGAILLRRVVQH